MPELRILFDAGDGVAAGLLGKAGALRHIFLSHADRDHLTGLLQLLQLNPLGARLHVHYPADCGSFPALAEFCRRFDPQTGPPTWLPIYDGDEIPIGGDRLVQAVHNPHVPRPPGTEGPATKSLSYFVIERKRTIKRDLRGISQKDIVARIRRDGRDSVTEVRERRLMAYSADTPILPASFWAGSEILLHEATFLSEEDSERRLPGDRHRHSILPEVLPMVAQVRPKQLILTHFSSRYSHAQITDHVSAGIAEHGIDFPVHVVLPGDTYQLAVDV